MDNEKNKMKMKMKKNKMKMKRAGLPSINVFPYKCSYYHVTRFCKGLIQVPVKPWEILSEDLFKICQSCYCAY